MLNIVKRIIALAWAIVCLDIIKIFVGEIKKFSNYDVWDWILFTIGLLLFIPVVIKFLNFFRRNQCPHCKCFFSLKKDSTIKVGEESISILTEVKSYNLSHRVVGTNEQYIPGKRIAYKDNFICKKCGGKSSLSYSRDKKSI